LHRNIVYSVFFWVCFLWYNSCYKKIYENYLACVAKKKYKSGMFLVIFAPVHHVVKLLTTPVTGGAWHWHITERVVVYVAHYIHYKSVNESSSQTKWTWFFYSTMGLTWNSSLKKVRKFIVELLNIKKLMTNSEIIDWIFLNWKHWKGWKVMLMRRMWM